MTDQTETPDLAELRRLLDAANSERVMSASLEMDYSLMRKSTRALFIAATNALPALLDAAAERDALAATVDRVRRECVIGKGREGWAAKSRAVLAILDEEPQP